MRNIIWLCNNYESIHLLFFRSFGCFFPFVASKNLLTKEKWIMLQFFQYLNKDPAIKVLKNIPKPERNRPFVEIINLLNNSTKCRALCSNRSLTSARYFRFRQINTFRNKWICEIFNTIMLIKILEKITWRPLEFTRSVSI